MAKGSKQEVVESVSLTDLAGTEPPDGLTTVMDFDALVAQSTNIAAHIGSGWTVVPTKEQHKLEGMPFVIVAMAERDGDYGLYYSLSCRLRNPIIIDGTETDRIILNDGSTGIYQQLSALLDLNNAVPSLPYYVSHGLHASHYTYKDDQGNEKPATTYYLDAR